MTGAERASGPPSDSAARACGKSRKEEEMSDEDQILSRTEVLGAAEPEGARGLNQRHDRSGASPADRRGRGSPHRRGRFHRATDSERVGAGRGIPRGGRSRGVKRDLSDRLWHDRAVTPSAVEAS